jgi:hypothetical protein
VPSSTAEVPARQAFRAMPDHMRPRRLEGNAEYRFSFHPSAPELSRVKPEEWLKHSWGPGNYLVLITRRGSCFNVNDCRSLRHSLQHLVDITYLQRKAYAGTRGAGAGGYQANLAASLGNPTGHSRMQTSGHTRRNDIAVIFINF